MIAIVAGCSDEISTVRPSPLALVSAQTPSGRAGKHDREITAREAILAGYSAQFTTAMALVGRTATNRRLDREVCT
jgi:hypothetical protein